MALVTWNSRRGQFYIYPWASSNFENHSQSLYTLGNQTIAPVNRNQLERRTKGSKPQHREEMQPQYAQQNRKLLKSSLIRKSIRRALAATARTTGIWGAVGQIQSAHLRAVTMPAAADWHSLYIYMTVYHIAAIDRNRNHLSLSPRAFLYRCERRRMCTQSRELNDARSDALVYRYIGKGGVFFYFAAQTSFLC